MVVQLDGSGYYKLTAIVKLVETLRNLDLFNLRIDGDHYINDNCIHIELYVEK